MKEFKLLYKIKSLEKLIARIVIGSLPDVKKVQITPTQMQIIAYILENSNKDIYQKDLEEVLGLRRATVSGVLYTMEKNHLIKRSTSMNDARVKKIVLNDEAKVMFLKGEEKIKKLEELMIRDLSEVELEMFSKIIDKMKDNINKYI